MLNAWKNLLKSRKFWLAVVGVVQSILFHFMPDFPDGVWVSVNALIAILIGAIAYEDAAAKRSGRWPAE